MPTNRCPLLAAGLVLSIATATASAIVALPAPRPPAPQGWTYQWVPPTYRTLSDRTWIPERRAMFDDWAYIDGRWERIYRESIVPGHWESTTRQVLVSPGYWQLVQLFPPPPQPPARIGGTVGVEGYANSTGEDLSKFSPLTEWPDKH